MLFARSEPNPGRVWFTHQLGCVTKCAISWTVLRKLTNATNSSTMTSRSSMIFLARVPALAAGGGGGSNWRSSRARVTLFIKSSTPRTHQLKTMVSVNFARSNGWWARVGYELYPQ